MPELDEKFHPLVVSIRGRQVFYFPHGWYDGQTRHVYVEDETVVIEGHVDQMILTGSAK